MKLSRNQILDFTLIAKKGVGRTHAKWSPCATCIMRAEPIIDFNTEHLKGMTDAENEEMVKRCPRHVYKYDSNLKRLDIEDANRCNLCNECVKYG
jgi:DNA-directed RNA polymerase alpha subunit